MIGQVIRFCVVGALSAGLNVAIIIFLTEVFRFHYLVSIVACFVLVTLCGFVMNRGWTFGVTGPGKGTQFLRYMMIAGLGVAITLIFSMVMVRAGLPYYGAAYGAAIILAPYNFFAHRYLSFRVHDLCKE